MARPVLPTDFKDDVLAESMSGKRRYRIIQNADGTVSLDDVTDYEQVGSTFGAKQVNDMSSAVNSIEDVKAANNCTTTEPGFVLDARQGKKLMDKSNELSRDFAGGQMEIRLTAAGKGEYRKKGADTWIPFKADPLNVVLKFAVDCTWDGAGHSYLTCSIDGQTFINHYLLPKSVYDQTFDLAVKGVPASIRIYVKYSWLDTGDHYDATITVNEFNFLNGTYGWNNTDNEKNISLDYSRNSI